MKLKTYILLAGFALVNLAVNAQTIWSGPIVTFSKADNADHTQAANQDMLTAGVILARASTQGIFNIASEGSYTKNSSPSGTEWVFGTTANLPIPSAFNNWQDAINNKPLDMLNKDMVVHLITDDIYVDIKFTQWTDGKSGSGGGYAYSRSSPLPSSLFDISADEISIYPNPAQSLLNLNGIRDGEMIEIRDSNGKLILNSVVKENSINIRSLSEGIYFLSTENHPPIKFIKQD